MDKFLKAIRFFESENNGDKPLNEIIRKGVEVFNNFPGFVLAAYYYLDPLEFDFHLKYTSNVSDKEELDKTFAELYDDGIISRSLAELDIVEHNGLFKNKHVSRIVIPLVGLNNVPGVILVISSSTQREMNSFTDVCRIFSRNLALIINNLELKEENEQLKVTTEQKIAFRIKNISHNKYDLNEILNSVQAGILLVNKITDHIEDANNMAASIIGTTKDNLIGTSSQLYFMLNDNTPANEKKISKEALIKRSNGRLLPIIKTTSGLILGGEEYQIHTFIDISERKRMEEALQDAHFVLEQRVEDRTLDLTKALEALRVEMLEREKAEKDLVKLFWAVNQNPCAIVLLDLKGMVEYANPRFEEITGFNLNKIVGSNASVIMPQDVPEELLPSIIEILNKGEEWHSDFRNVRSVDEFYWISTTVSSIRNNDGEIVHYMVVAEDITEKKNAENELISAKKKVEDSNKFKSYLLQNMSHEFRTPLISIIGFSQILIEEITDPDFSLMINSVFLSGKRLLHTLDEVLNLSQVEADEIKINREVVNLTEFLPWKTKLFVDFGIRKNLTFNIYYNTGNLNVLIDKSLFSKVIYHILDNAFKYTNKGSVDVVVDKTFNEGREWVIVKVIDTGIGISVTKQQIIFEAFRQASEGLARQYEGCGLGLTLSRKLTELMDGLITLESEPEKGSIFTIWLPAIG